jgi:hypothetical protein
MCFNEILGFLKISTSLRTRSAAETWAAEGEFLQLTVKKGGVSEITSKNLNVCLIFLALQPIVVFPQPDSGL